MQDARFKLHVLVQHFSFRLHFLSKLFLASLFLLFITSRISAYDLNQVRIEKLQNGLTVMIFEDHAQPVISTQMLYKVGARNECEGTTGLAHFLEHMAYRATKNFPNTEVVSRIYGVGGEWHGYTFLDQTTYFETVPVEDFDLVLRIQADRMNGALIKAEEVQAERGAVITELHSYENDPASLLNDLVMATSFLEHPYRNNTIGWISDVEKIQHDDIVNFYHRFYNPANAVFAIAGDVKTEEAIAKVHEYFDPIPAGKSEVEPRTVEPPQMGERRIILNGSGRLNYFQIAYQAPAAHDPDYPAFLALQGILTGSGGVNFRQRGEGEPAVPGSMLYGMANGIATFFIPTADPYAFSITGRTDPSHKQEDIERTIERQLAHVRDETLTREQIESVKKEIQEELVFDLETTEDAAHQMAFFEGIDAFPILQNLPELISKITPDDVKRVAQKYLQPYQRTVGWYLTNGKPVESEPKSPPSRGAAKTAPPSPVQSQTFEPRVKKLKNGMILIAQKITRSPTGFLRILIPSNAVEIQSADYSPDDPSWGYTSINWKFLKDDLAQIIPQAAKVWDAKFEAAKVNPVSLEDPDYRLNYELEKMIRSNSHASDPLPALIVVVGDIDENEAFSLLEKSFGNMKAGKSSRKSPVTLQNKEKTVRIPGKAQSQFGYAVPAPAPSEPSSYAYRILLYIMTHAYEGRLGHELINQRGLIYYIGNSYNSDGTASWISITMGVNPENLKACKAIFDELMQDLRKNPPRESEVAEAKHYLIGRRISAHESNNELSAFYAQEWIEQGRLIGLDEFEKKVQAVTLDQVRKIIPAFLNGATVVIDTSN